MGFRHRTFDAVGVCTLGTLVHVGSFHLTNAPAPDGRIVSRSPYFRCILRRCLAGTRPSTASCNILANKLGILFLKSDKKHWPLWSLSTFKGSWI